MIRAATSADPLRVGVLVSGSGTNLAALLERFNARPDAAVRVVAVASSRVGVRALTRAAAAGVDHAVFERGDDAAGRDRRLAAWLAERRVELVVLAGYLGILTGPLLAGAPAINVHPSLLPAFPGATPVADALAHGVRISGVTVHLVDDGLDSGPILLQEAVPVRYDDTPASLLDRLHAVEHRLLPAAVALLAADRVTISGRQVAMGQVATHVEGA